MPAEDREQRRPQERPLREIVQLASMAAEGSMQACPSDQWSWHYPKNGAVREKRLQELHDGRADPKTVANDLKPDALLYNLSDVEKHGLPVVADQIQEMTERVQHYNYERFAQFIASMQGRDVDLNAVQQMYDAIATSRIQSQLLRAKVGGGLSKVKRQMNNMGQHLASNLHHQQGLERAFSALQLQWLESKGFVKEQELLDALGQLTPKDRNVVDALQDHFQQYVNQGDEEAYQQLVSQVHTALPQIQEAQDQTSPEMEKLQQELEEFIDQVPEMGDPGGPEFPPDAKDLHNQMEELQGGESVEGIPHSAYFEITPSGTSNRAMTGHYAIAHKTRFDEQSLTWSNDTQLDSQEYTQDIQGEKRQTMKARINTGLKNVPLPETYALDMQSLQFTGARPRFYRDQNQKFYVFAEGVSEFTVDFLKEPTSTQSAPTTDDLQPLPGGSLSQQTELYLQSLNGSPEEIAKKIQAYILQSHWYPGGGDSNAANALKLKIKSESRADTYVQNIDASEYLDCDLAGTLWVHMMRRAGVHARISIGHHVQGLRDGKACIDGSNGHAWGVYWNGSQWVPVDPTPWPKPEDKKEDEEDKEEESQEEGEQADDGMTDRPPEPQTDMTDQMQQKVDEQMQSLQGQQQASDQTAQQAQHELQQAQQKLEQMQKQQGDLQQKMDSAEDFVSLEKLREEARQADLLNDMKSELEEKAQYKKEERKRKMQEAIQELEEGGFIEKEQAEKLQQQGDSDTTADLDQLQQQVKQESKDFEDYLELRAEVMPLVYKWFNYFVERLPREEEFEVDEDSRSRQGKLNKRLMMHPRNQMLGTVKNPRVMRPDVQPKFIASIVLDVSGSVKQSGRFLDALKLAIFYAELFSLIEETYGYLRFSIHVFENVIREIKSFDQDYLSPERYLYQDGEKESRSTVRARIMKAVRSKGGTNMLPALRHASEGLNREKAGFQDYVSALYFVGDGGDTCYNTDTIQIFMDENNKQNGFGDHVRSAFFIGSQGQEHELSDIFGKDHTCIAPTFEELIDLNMQKFDQQISFYTDQLSVEEQ